MIIESLVRQHSLEKVINCIFSKENKDDNVEIIIDYLIRAEGISTEHLLLNSLKQFGDLGQVAWNIREK